MMLIVGLIVLHTCKENYSKAKWYTAYLRRAKGRIRGHRQRRSGLPMVCKIVKLVYGWRRPADVGNVPYTHGSRNIRLYPTLAGQQRVHVEAYYMDTPSGKREETLHLGAYVDDLCVLYEHDDKLSLYHDFTTKRGRLARPHSPRVG